MMRIPCAQRICIVDIGPGAGEHGGQLVGMGTAEELMQNPKSITGAYLSGKLKIPVPEVRKGTYRLSDY